MITFKKFPNHGRLGNQLFQYAATLGIANKLKQRVYLPPWDIAQYMEGQYPDGLMQPPARTAIVNEIKFEHDPEILTRCESVIAAGGVPDLFGYFQSEKYWAHCRPLVRNAMAFKKDFLDQLRRKYWRSFEGQKKVIAIHVRRGDYVGNPNYAQLPVTYYLTALIDNFPDWRKGNIIVFGDDISYCKLHFDCLDNVAFAEGNSPIEDMALGSMCHHFIIPNSSFGWWMAYLGQKNGTKVIRPTEHFAGGMAKNSIKDYYPEGWVRHWAHKLNLTDVTFTIPVAYDHKDRKKNLDLCVCMLQHNFDTNIIIGEQGGTEFKYMERHAKYMGFGLKYFHRTRMLNQMAGLCQTPFVANWDADVMVSPLQLWESVERLRSARYGMVYPYNGQFARVPRLPWFKKLEESMDLGVVGDTKFNGMNNNDAESKGGAVLWNVNTFRNAGMENENFVSFGPEDEERYYRTKTLRIPMARVSGPLYHINHWVGPNSSNRHPHVKQNRAEWDKILNYSAEELLRYVKTWPWTTK